VKVSEVVGDAYNFAVEMRAKLIRGRNRPGRLDLGSLLQAIPLKPPLLGNNSLLIESTGEH
jgi:hypothetical protein